MVLNSLLLLEFLTGSVQGESALLTTKVMEDAMKIDSDGSATQITILADNLKTGSIVSPVLTTSLK